MEINKNNFEAEVLHSDKPVLLDFWASWCGPCRMLAPVIEELAADYSGKLKVGKINVDEENALAAQFGIAGIPTVVIMKNGKITNISVGFVPKKELEQMINESL